MRRMGFTEKEAQQIINFQSKGGRFFQKSDFKKLYCVSDEDYQLLEPYIQIASNEKPEQKWESTKALPHVKLNLNDVDSDQLQKIPGIGQKTASRIVRYREKLGGFVHIHQLKEVYAIDSSRFLQVEPYLFVDKENIKKLNINELDIKDILRKFVRIDNTLYIVSKITGFNYNSDINNVQVELISVQNMDNYTNINY